MWSWPVYVLGVASGLLLSWFVYGVLLVTFSDDAPDPGRSDHEPRWVK